MEQDIIRWERLKQFMQGLYYMLCGMVNYIYSCPYQLLFTYSLVCLLKELTDVPMSLAQ